MVNLFLFIFLQVNFTWTDDDYTKYDTKTFFEIPQVNEYIDLNDIDYPLLNAAVFYETNNKRNLNNLPEFIFMKVLEKAASEHSKDMVERDFFSHTSVIKGKQHLKQRLEKYGIKNGTMAESIIYIFAIQLEENKTYYPPSQNDYNYFSYKHNGEPIKNHTYKSLAKKILMNWMKSPNHKANILNINLKNLGCGGYLKKAKKIDDVPIFYYTQNFSD